MNELYRIISYIQIYAFPLFGLITCSIFMNIAALSLVLFPNLRIRIIRRIFQMFQDILTFSVLTKTNRKIYFYSTHDLVFNPPKRAIHVCNHQSVVDNIILCLFLRPSGFSASLRYFFKRSLIYVPFLGSSALLLDFVPLSRKDLEKDLQMLNRVTKRACNKERDDTPNNLVIFPEGTRITPHALELSTEFLTNAGLPHTKYCLAPRLSGLKEILMNYSDSYDYVLDWTIVYYDRTKAGNEAILSPNWRRFGLNPNHEVHVMVKAYPIADIKKLGNDCKFMYEWFKQKDMYFEQLCQNGKLDEELVKSYKFKGQFDTRTLDSTYEFNLGLVLCFTLAPIMMGIKEFLILTKFFVIVSLIVSFCITRI